MASYDASTNAESRIGLWRFIEEAQRMKLARTTAYGAYRKAGGTKSAAAFRRLWRLAQANPFNWRGDE